MAEIKPFRAWRYNSEIAKNIDPYLSPLFDVVSDRQREILYQNPYNSIHISVPKGPEPAAAAAHTLKSWKENGILIQDYLPGIYVYYQYFNLPGIQEAFCRKGFVCMVRTYDWDEAVVLRHENTMPPAVEERVNILKSTQFNASATHGLYSDPSFSLERIMDECMTDPIIEAEDYQGVRESLCVIQDASAIRKFIDTLKDQQIILADGHHRYQGSINYRKYCQQNNPEHRGDEGYNYHMIFLTNMEAKDLRILATHRMVRGIPDFDPENFISKTGEFFHLNPVNNPEDINDVILGKKATFGIVMKDRALRATLKPGLEKEIRWPFPPIIKELDLTILHYYILERALGIKGKDQRTSTHIDFDRNFTDCITRVNEGESQMALITNELSMEEVKKVCFSGFTLPQKSTYFYPKVVCGLLFASIEKDEFQDPNYPRF